MEPVPTAGGERILQVFEMRLTQSIKALSFAQLLESSNVSVAAILLLLLWHWHMHGLCSACSGAAAAASMCRHAPQTWQAIIIPQNPTAHQLCTAYSCNRWTV